MTVHPSFPIQLVDYLKNEFGLGTFVETGTYLGGTAFECSHIFKNVITLEASLQLYEAARQRYAHVANILFVQGSSATQLHPVVQKLNEAAFFWLDAHWSGGPTYGEQDECPLIAELEAVNASDFDHFILIDDARLFLVPPPPPHNPDQWPGLAEIINLLERKERYVVVYQDRILAVPSFARDKMIRFLQSHDEEVLSNLDAQKNVGNGVPQTSVALQISPDQMQKAADIFQFLLDADDISEAIEVKSGEFEPVLVELIKQNIRTARQNGESELADGLETLAGIVSEKIKTNPPSGAGVVAPSVSKSLEENQPETTPQENKTPELLIKRIQQSGAWSENKPLRLHLGCGENHFDGYVNIDYPPDEHTVQTKTAADVFADITRITFSPQTVDEIRSHHVFEHFDRAKGLAQLIHWTEWLKLDGRLIIETPDLWGSIESLIKKPDYGTQQAILRHVFGSHEAAWAYHYDGWYEEKFVHILSALGYEVSCKRWQWPHPPYLSNILVTAIKKKTLSRDELVRAADVILAESMVANVPEEQQMNRVWALNMRSFLHEPTPVPDLQPPAVVNPDLHCNAIVFSKDRPMQLDAALQSLLAHEKSGILKIEVLYTVSNDELFEPLYARLKTKFSQVHFNREQDFQQDVIKLAASADYTLFLVDDALFVRDFNVLTILQEMEKRTAVLGCSLRLGANTHYFYMLDREQNVPEIKKVNGTLSVYEWVHADGDYTYPLEVSSSIYRASELTVLLDHIQFNSPNSLEARMAAMAQGFATRYPYLLCYETSVAFCAPINKVQTEAYLNRSGVNAAYSVNHLAQAYRDGYLINTAVYEGFISNGVHQEINLKLVKQDEKPPEVSVIIPCYNYGHYLKDCITSLAGQTYRDFEVFIINDGSTDNSTQVAEELIKNFPQLNIKLINQVNSGQPAITRNNGIALARGKFILPLDADDYIDRRMLEASVDVLHRREDVSIVSTDAIYFDGQNTRRVNALDFNPKLLPHQNHLSYCSLYRYAVWESVGGYRTNVRGFEDWDFWVAAAERGYQVFHLDKALFYYRVKQDGVFSQTKEHEQELHAHMILNNPASYRADERDWARKVLNGEVDQPREINALVSVIMPTHNRREELLKAVESVLNQTYPNFELIIINDAGEEVKQLLPSDARIRYTRLEKNRGAGGARNEGLKQAKGKYLAFLDDDDSYYPDHLKLLVTELEKDPSLAAVYSDAMQVDWIVEGNQVRAGNRSVVYSFDFSLEQLLVLNFIPNLCLMIRSDIVQKAGGFDENLSALEDWEWLIRCALLGDYKHLRSVTAEYQVRLGGQSRNMLQPDVMLKLYATIYGRYALYAARPVMDGQAQMLKKLAGIPVDMNGYDPEHSRARLILKRIIEAEDISARLESYKNELDKNLIEVVRLERKNALTGGDEELADGLMDLENYILSMMNTPVK